MTIPVKCTGCKASLKLREEYAGKKVKCPRCQTVLIVPELEEAAAEAIAEEEEEDRIQPSPQERPGRTRRVQREQPTTSKRPRREDPDDRDDDEQPSRTKKKKGGKESKYKPCPKCGAEGATRVKWTAWGSFYGPALFTHVCCPDCGNCYNGKTGRSNALAATLFVSIPLLGIAGIIGAVIYIVVLRGYSQF